jgi:aspartate aminotransferase-like enzyme
MILTSSGTGALEAAVVNHLSMGDSVLGVTIGSFGDRFAEIAERYGADVRRLETEWGRAARPADVAHALREMAAAGRPAKAVLLTHNETSTSGLGAVPFESDAWGLDVVATGSQKSWMVPPGIAMVSVSERAWAAAAEARMPRFYFDLTEARRFQAKGETPWTPAVSVLFGLDVALDMMEAEGYSQIFERHAACGAAARAGLRAAGFSLLAEAGHASDTVTAAHLPDGVEWPALDRELRARHLVIAGGQGRLAGRILRVGHLGDVTVNQVADAVEIIEQAASAVGLPVENGAARRAAEGATREPVTVRG